MCATKAEWLRGRGERHCDVARAVKERRRFLTECDQSTLRSELWKSVRLAGIARPDAMCVAAASAQAFGNIQEFYGDEIDCGWK